MSEKLKKYKAAIQRKIVNKDYYLKAFEHLEKEKKHTWNWAAFLFPREWMIYRKMYLWSTIFWLIYMFVLYIFVPILEAFAPDYGDLLLLTLVALVKVFAEYFGNELYYRTVKCRISKGYHLLKKYVCASWPFFISVALVAATMANLLIYWFSVPFFLDTDIVVFARFSTFSLVLSAAWGLDCLQNHLELSKTKPSEDDIKINQENLSLYLEQRKENHVFGKIFVMMLFVIFLISSRSYRQFKNDMAKFENRTTLEATNTVTKN